MSIRRALISVSDKSNLIPFAQRLRACGVEILSTGGTYKALAGAEIEVTEVAEITGFPEIMDGRVKTLHPKIHGGILGRRGVDDAVMTAHGIVGIDLVVINLYPFAQTIAQPDCSREDAIENIDIGGPAMVRAAAKNHAHVAVVVSPSDYDQVAAQIEADGALSEASRRQLATRAFAHTANYDAAVAAYLSSEADATDQQAEAAQFPGVLGLQFHKISDLRYGENPHQQAAFYREASAAAGSIAAAEQLQGKPLSYNNIADADAALACVRSFVKPACVIVKHANPCGVAVSLDGIAKAYADAPDLENLVLAPEFTAFVHGAQSAWRRVVALAVTHGVPVLALARAVLGRGRGVLGRVLERPLRRHGERPLVPTGHPADALRRVPMWRLRRSQSKSRCFTVVTFVLTEVFHNLFSGPALLVLNV